MATDGPRRSETDDAQEAVRDEPSLETLVPDNPNQPYDIKVGIYAICGFGGR